MTFVSKSVKETGKIAADLAEKILAQKPEKRSVTIALEGELGAGKTVFVKAFAKALGIKEKITSPTFVILRSFKLDGSRFENLIHIDAYRLSDGQELKPLGIEDIFAAPKNIVLIEWAERVSEILPEKYIKIHIDHIVENERKITINF